MVINMYDDYLHIFTFVDTGFSCKFASLKKIECKKDYYWVMK